MSYPTSTAPVQHPNERASSDETASRYEAARVVRHLAHELRQPLSTIESIAYYLGIVLPPSDGKSRKQVEKLQQVVHQAGWILSDAIHFLQASPPAPQTIDLDEFVSRAVRDAGAADSAWLRLELAGEPVLARLDPDQAGHLLRNLVQFFRQATRPDQLVWIRTATEDTFSVILFEVEGVDFSPSELEAMFEPFTPHLPAGSGLALASVRRIVEVHQGSLELLQSDTAHRLRLRLAFNRAGS